MVHLVQIENKEKEPTLTDVFNLINSLHIYASGKASQCEQPKLKDLICLVGLNIDKSKYVGTKGYNRFIEDIILNMENQN